MESRNQKIESSTSKKVEQVAQVDEVDEKKRD